MYSINDNVLKTRNIQRQLCRTNIYALCKILGYIDISKEVHGPIVDILPKLPGGKDIEVSPGTFKYRPYKEIWQLEGKRERLILYPRGHLKTSIISQAHLIQWIINFPNIRILLSCATGDQVEKVVRAIRGVFQFNEDFRILFPEFCPQKIDDFGSSQQFITPARTIPRGEPTLFSVTAGKTIAGYHPDVIFHSDLVDKENVKTPAGINDIIDHFKYMNPLLERYSAHGICNDCEKIFSANIPEICDKCKAIVTKYPPTRGFTFVEGTPYDFGDLHNKLMESEEYNDWLKVIKPAQEDYPTGKILWPSRFTKEELAKIKKEIGNWLFNAQYLMKCIPQGDGLCDPRDVLFIPRVHLGAIVPTLRLHVTIDLAGMEETSKGDFTVITLGGFDRDGRLYIMEIHCGHYAPETVIQIMFDLHDRWPNIIDYKIEKDAHARVLLPFLQRANSKRGNEKGKWLPAIIQIKRDTHRSKQERIKGLRPWFKATPPIIRFNDDDSGIPLGTKNELLSQIGKFPSQSSGVHDDILDTLADLMQNEEGTVTSDVIADAPDLSLVQFGRDKRPDRFLGFDEEGISQWLYGPDPGYSRKVSKTGFLD